MENFGFNNQEMKMRSFDSYIKEYEMKRSGKKEEANDESIPDISFEPIKVQVPNFSNNSFFGGSPSIQQPIDVPIPENNPWDNHQQYKDPPQTKNKMLNVNIGGSYTIDVPAGVRYLSDWKEFSFYNFNDISIINKQIPGCGMTEYSLTGPEYVILCSPRKLLLQNKKDQHGDDVFLVKNEMERDICVDFDLNNGKRSNSISSIVTKNDQIETERAENKEIYKKIYNEFNEYVNYMDSKNQYVKPPYKILVTYDSYHIIKDILIRMGIFYRFFTIVDEFQSILHDARFKSTTELRFLKDLGLSDGYDIRMTELEMYKNQMSIKTDVEEITTLKRDQNYPTKILFVSATPILEEYIKQLNSFRNIPYYTLDWYKNDPSRVIKPDLKVNYMSSISSKSKEIIDSYLSGNFDSVFVMRNNQPVEIKSTEAVFYVNSVSQILTIIFNNKLKPDQVNILCANTDDNRKKIRGKLGKLFDLGHIPIKGEPNKMFTFCTRTVYLGADFYSKCAKSFIFSDSNSDCLAVDISEDLPQILGRQRDNDNPWKNAATFYYKTTADYKKMSQSDFDDKINEKKEKTARLLENYKHAQYPDDCADNYRKVAKMYNYRDDYVSVDSEIVEDKFSKMRKEILRPVENDLVMVNEIRAFRIQQIDYKDRFAVFSTIENKFDVNNSTLISQQISNFFNIYDQFNTIHDKLRYLCEFSKTVSNDLLDAILAQLSDKDDVKSYFTTLGPDRLYELGYNITKIKKDLNIITFSPELLVNSIYSNFHVGDKYLLSDIKDKLANLYNSINYRKTPKAIDLSGFFEVKTIFLYNVLSDGTKKRAKGYELINSYEDKIRLDMRMSK